MMRSVKAFPLLTLAAALVASGCKKSEAPAGGADKKIEAPATRSQSAAVSKATDDIPTSNRTEMYLDRYRFGIATDADGIVVKESDWIPPGSIVAISLYLRNAPAGSELRIVWNDVSTRAARGEEVKPVGEKGFVTFKNTNPLPEGSYVAELFFREPKAKEWRDLGGHNFKVGIKS